MKKTILALLAAAFCATVSAQQIVRSENVAPFTTVSFSGEVNVELIKGDSPIIYVELYDADLKNLKWNVSDGNLSVSLRPMQTKNGTADIKVYYTGELSAISVNKGTLTIKEPLETLTAKLSVGAGAKLVGNFKATDLQLEVSGNSAALLEGETVYLSLRATERSKIDTRKLVAVSVEVETTMGSEATLSVVERLVANAKTGSSIFYTGSPSIIRNLSSKLSTSVGSSVLSID